MRHLALNAVAEWVLACLSRGPALLRALALPCIPRPVLWRLPLLPGVLPNLPGVLPLCIPLRPCALCLSLLRLCLSSLRPRTVPLVSIIGHATARRARETCTLPDKALIEGGYRPRLAALRAQQIFRYHLTHRRPLHLDPGQQTTTAGAHAPRAGA